jgi:oligosaccharyltransferase complex subunit alpha (ribophorin I)
MFNVLVLRLAITDITKVTYTYPFTAGLRKPLTVAAGLFSIFVGVWFIGSLDVSIKKR